MSQQGIGDAAVRFDRVTVTLGGVHILDDVSATVPRGGCTAVVGPNGAGKTTLLLALLGRVPYRGRIRLEGTRGMMGPRIGYVPQRLAFDRGMPVTVSEFLAMGRQRTPLWAGVRRASRTRAAELLEAVDSGHLAGRALGALSGGEMQRVLLALALQQDPDLLVLDEPVAGVDFQGEHMVCELLERLRRARGFTQLMVSHDLATVAAHATHVICLNRFVAAEGPPREALTSANLAAIFGPHRGLTEAGAVSAEADGGPSSCCRPVDHA